MSKLISHRGFTLVELMVVMLVLGVFASMAAPSFSSMVDNARLKTQIEGVVDLLEFSKSEARKRSIIRIAVVSGSSWSLAANVYDPTDGTTVIETRTTPSASLGTGNTSLSTNSGLPQIMNFDFRGVVSGYVNDNLTLQSRLGTTANITINPIGQITVCVVGGKIGSYASC